MTYQSTSCPTKKLVPGPKMTHSWPLSMVLKYTFEKTMERRFQTVQNFLTHPTYISCPTLKLPSNPKINKNSCSLSMFMSFTVRNPVEKRFQKDHKKISPRPKMTRNHPESKNIPVMFSDQ